MADNAQLMGHGNQIESFLASYASGKLHHAWLLTGDMGIGKAHFAFHAASVLLQQAKKPTTLADFRQALSSVVARQILQGSHPDFRHVAPSSQKVSTIISVDQIRALSTLFQSTAGMGGWRVAIIDAADDMNTAAANAILKVLEEPPARCVFFLISHTPGRLLPTIRSRCRTLQFSPLADEEVQAIVEAASDESAEDVAAILPMAVGSPGRALWLLEGHALDYMAAINRMFAALPAFDRQTVLGLADQMSDRASTPAYKVGWSLLQDVAARSIRACVAQGGELHSIPLERWLAFADNLSTSKRQIDGLNLSPRQSLIAHFSALATA